MEKIKWLTGVKAIFAIMVIFRHYANAFFPALHTGLIENSKVFLGKAENMISVENFINTTPLYFVINGSFAVYIFWTISAFLISYHFFINESKSSIDMHYIMQRKAIKKYLGIGFPILISYICVYIMMKLGLFYNIETAKITKSEWLACFYNWNPAISQVIKGLFIDTFFTANVPFNPVLWTIMMEFKGSIILILLLTLFGTIKKKWYLWGSIVVLNLLVFSLPYMCFNIGMLLGYMYAKKVKVINEYFAVFIFIISIILGSYPSDFQPMGVFEWVPTTISMFGIVWDMRTLIYITAAGLMLFSIINSRKLQLLFELKGFEKVGTYSMEMYITHFIIECSFSCVFFSSLYFLSGRYILSFAVTMLVSLILIIIVSKLLNMVNSKYNKRLNTLIEKALE